MRATEFAGACLALFLVLPAGAQESGDGVAEKEEQKEKKDQEESLLVLLDPNYVAPWAREYP